jgi:hypothetical protein
MKEILTLIFIAIQINLGLSQINGVVYDAKDVPISDANVTLFNKSKGTVADYSFTDTLGKFLLKKTLSPSDYYLIVSYFGYRPDTTIIQNNKAENLIVKLKPEDFLLSEVTIKAKVFEVRGDTLIYSVAMLKDETDLVIGDVMKKIPGLTIENNGQIKYNGLPINSLNVNGKNLVGGSHQLITKNIDPKDITDIEVIKSHQPIRILRGNETNPRATINLNTKAKHLVTGNAEAAIGLKNPLWKLKGNLMDFGRTVQYTTAIASNNIGENYGNQFMSSQGNFAIVNSTISTLRLTEAQQQNFIDQKYSRFNNEKVAGGKFLFSKKYLDINLGIDLAKNALINQGSELERKNALGENFTFTKDLYSKNTINKFNANLKAVLNSDHIYISSETEFNNLGSSGSSDNIINALRINERNSNKNLKFSNNSFYITKVFGTILKFRSKLEYEDNNENLFISPSDFLIKRTPFYYENNQQLLTQDKWKGALFSSVLFGNDSKGFSIEYGYNYEQKKVNSDLFFRDSLQIMRPLDEFANANKFSNHGLYTILNGQLRKKRFTMVANSKLELASVQLTDLETSSRPAQTAQRFIIEPSLFIKYKINNFIEPKLSIDFDNRPFIAGFSHFNPLLVSYRNVKNNSPLILDKNTTSYDITLPYQDDINIWGISLFMKGDQTIRKYLNNVFVSNNGENLQIDTDNQSKMISHSYGMIFDATHFEKKIDLKIQYARSRMLESYNLNGLASENLQFTHNASLRMDKRSKKWNAFISSDIQFFKSQVEDQNFTNLRNVAQLQYKFKSNKFTSVKYQMVSNFDRNEPQHFHMFELNYTYAKPKYNINVGLSNPFNIKNIVTILQNNYTYSVYRTAIRPRQLIIEYKYKF